MYLDTVPGSTVRKENCEHFSTKMTKCSLKPITIMHNFSTKLYVRHVVTRTVYFKRLKIFFSSFVTVKIQVQGIEVILD